MAKKQLLLANQTEKKMGIVTPFKMAAIMVPS